jgi:hypothetical protein
MLLKLSWYNNIMKNIRDILPIMLDENHATFLKNKFVFLLNSPERVNESNIVFTINQELNHYMTLLQHVNLLNSCIHDKLIFANVNTNSLYIG